MNLDDTRTAIADVLNTVAGLNVRPYAVKTPKPGDGWVNFTRIAPSGFSTTTCDCTYTVVITLGADERHATERAAELSVPVINAVTTGPLHPDGVSLEPAVLPVGDVSPGNLYALILTLTLEVD
jgi:hypothetical protein